MSARATVTKLRPGGHPFYVRLRALGCVYCARCRCYMYPEHVCHDWTCGKVYEAPPVVTVLAGELEAVA